MAQAPRSTAFSAPSCLPPGEAKARRPWDPANAWPAGRRWLWVTLAVVVCALQGPSFVRSLRPPPDRGLDFFQDWASARNRLEGLPVYTRHEVTAQRYLGLEVDTSDPFFV